MKTAIVGISKGKITINLGSSPEENGEFELNDFVGPAQFLLTHSYGALLCSSSCDFPQDDGAPEGWKFDIYWQNVCDAGVEFELAKGSETP